MTKLKTALSFQLEESIQHVLGAISENVAGSGKKSNRYNGNAIHQGYERFAGNRKYIYIIRLSRR